VVVLQFG